MRQREREGLGTWGLRGLGSLETSFWSRQGGGENGASRCTACRPGPPRLGEGYGKRDAGGVCGVWA